MNRPSWTTRPGAFKFLWQAVNEFYDHGSEAAYLILECAAELAAHDRRRETVVSKSVAKRLAAQRSDEEAKNL